MSCVIGLITNSNEVILAADNQSSDGVIKVKSDISKIVVRDASLNTSVAIGCVGGLKIGNFSRYVLSMPKAPPVIDKLGKTQPDVRYMERDSKFVDSYVIGTFVPHFAQSYINYCRKTATGVEVIEDGLLIGILGRLYYVDSMFGVHVSTENFEVIGSARDLAYGVMMACNMLKDYDPLEMIDVVFKIAGDLSLYSNGEYNTVTV